MNHNGTKTLETKRLLLRKFETNDIQYAYDNWTSKDAVTKFLTWPTHIDTTVTEKIINEWIAQYDNPNYYQWAIVLKEIDEPIGSISVVNIDEDLELVEIGYCIGDTWWHQGITSEAFAAIITYLFEEVGVNRIEAKHDLNNPYSGEVMKKCGLSYEGTLRQRTMNNQGVVDAALYSILREDYKKKEN